MCCAAQHVMCDPCHSVKGDTSTLLGGGSDKAMHDNTTGPMGGWNLRCDCNVLRVCGMYCSMHRTTMIVVCIASLCKAWRHWGLPRKRTTPWCQMVLQCAQTMLTVQTLHRQCWQCKLCTHYYSSGNSAWCCFQCYRTMSWPAGWWYVWVGVLVQSQH